MAQRQPDPTAQLRHHAIPGMPAPAGAFVRAFETPLSGRIVYLSGVTAVTESGTIADPDDLSAEHTPSSSTSGVASSKNLTPASTTSPSTTDMRRWDRIEAARRRWLGDTWPATTSLEVSWLVNPDALLEIEAVPHLTHLPEDVSTDPDAEGAQAEP